MVGKKQNNIVFHPVEKKGLFKPSVYRKSFQMFLRQLIYRKRTKKTENQECRFHTVKRHRQSVVGIEHKSLKIK